MTAWMARQMGGMTMRPMRVVSEEVHDNFLSNPHLGLRVVHSGHWMYQVDLAHMTQTNVQHAAHKQRKIRRIELVGQ
jgi:hypothetical protein